MKDKISQEETKAKKELESKLKQQQVQNNKLLEQKLKESDTKLQTSIHSQELSA